MAIIKKTELAAMLLKNYTIRTVEPDIYPVLPSNEFGSENDSQFGFIYDIVACNPIYNRLIWGYSVNIFAQNAIKALHSSHAGHVLDIGCGSLAFTAKTYIQNGERKVVLVDQSLKMLRMAKSRLLKESGKVPDNLVFLHANALQLPFKEYTFTTVICENLLHCIDDTSHILKQLKTIISTNGKMYFTTLVKSNRLADKYLQALADNGKLISRSVNDLKDYFKKSGLSINYEIIGDILSIECSINQIE